MVRIQLENGYLDIKEGSNFPLNFGVADIRDVTQKSGATSKTLIAVGSKNNHTLLNHYYDVNIVAGTFDINALTKCSVIQEGIPIMEDCYLQLLSVNKVQPNSQYEDSVEYELMVKDAQSNLFTELDNKYLTDLDFSDLNHVISATNIVATFNNTITDGYKYLLPWSSDNQYPVKEMRPAIYAKKYFDAIFASNGFSYTWATSAAAKFEKLLIPYNGDLPILNYDIYEVQATKVDTYNFPQSAGINVSSFTLLDNMTEVLDGEALFNPTTGEYTSPFIVSSGEAIVYNFSVDIDLSLDNTTGSTAYLYAVNPASAYIYTPTIRLYKNGVLYVGGLPFASFTKNVTSNTLASGVTSVINGTFSTNVPISGLLTTDIVTAEIGVSIVSNGSPLWKDANSGAGTNVQVDMILDVTALTMTVQPGTNIVGSGSVIDMNRFIPKKIKQRDFVKGILSMFNLFVEVDKDTPNNLILQHRDDYFDSGAVKDWTLKLCKDLNQQLIFLPDITAKKMVLTYKADKDLPNTDYIDVTNEIYGQLEYEFDTEYQKGIDVKEMIFSPTPTGKTVFDAYVPFIAGSAPNTNIRILIDGGTDTCGAYDIYDYDNVGETGLTTYPLIGHFDNPLNPTFDLNFATCDFYYYNGVLPTNNNLYNKYWRRTVNQINTGKMLVAFFDLNEADIQSLRLNDKIRIDNSWWNINRVIDYNANVKGFTKVELISIDTEIDLPPFNYRIPKLPTDAQIGKVTKEIINTSNTNNNVVMLGADVIVKGRNNVILGGTKGMIVGNGNVVSDEYVNINENESVGANFANTDLTVTGTRAHNLDGNMVGFLEGNTFFQNNTGTSGPVVSMIGTDDTVLYIQQPNGAELALETNGRVKMLLFTFANDAAAGVGGLTTGELYQTATGELRIKL